MTSTQYAEVLHAIETVYGRKGGAHLIAALPAPVDAPHPTESLGYDWPILGGSPVSVTEVRDPVPSNFEHIMGTRVVWRNGGWRSE